MGLKQHRRGNMKCQFSYCILVVACYDLRKHEYAMYLTVKCRLVGRQPLDATF
jgi:hypothetical protein